MSTMEKQSKAIDLSHHLSDYVKSIELSPLKGLQKYFGRADMISFAGGMPSPAYFPFASVSADILDVDAFPLDNLREQASSPLAWLWRLFGTDKGTEHTTRVVVPKAPVAGDDGLNLATALQYGPATGIAKTQKFIHDFTARVHQPAYSDFATLVHAGNTDGWSRVVKALCNPGDTIITEDWTYPSAVANATPVGVNFLPVPMDGQGMRPDSLRKLLAEWDETKGRRPHLMYTVPVGQNPTGATMGKKRKQEIYDLCVEYDVIICEDDPYYFLQLGDYVSKPARASEPTFDPTHELAQWIVTLEPSYLRVDYQGRVIRLETFSKTVAPGTRLGWFTCNSRFAERLERIGETTTQSPCGLGQVLVMKLLETWSFDGYVRWLQGIRTQYKMRRDFFIDVLADEFDLQLGTHAQGIWAGAPVYTAYSKPTGGYFMREKSASKALFSFVPPSSGMFLWIRLHFDAHSAFVRGTDDAESLEMQFWTQLAEGGVLTAPGHFFAALKDAELPGVASEGHLRMAFSMSETADARRGLLIFAKTIREFFKV
ncbi:PLP-dependent transferase [Artomyces pyxidatus]|uniref:PLP-dependent transferase n=1 Tax=Artomyces pyxidatus TaxID=48021 RepID=A0ACB8TBJ8_9AGAM|nr:PLP-dependent transferase [Artomyces pyxidatus]